MKKKQSKKKKNNINKQDKLIQASIIEDLIHKNKSQLSKIICNNIKNITYTQKEHFKQLIITQLQKQFQIVNHKQENIQQFLQSINDRYCQVYYHMRDKQISTPIIQAWYQSYEQIWKKLSKYNQKLFSLWKYIPSTKFCHFLDTFNLQSSYKTISEQNMFNELILLLNDNKVQQVCIYYHHYMYSDRQISKFQKQYLIPKLIKSEHIFSSYVISMLTDAPILKNTIINLLDPSLALRLIQNLKEDARNYPLIYSYILKQHYKSIIYDHKYWFIVQDKISFQIKFIEWFVQDLISLKNKNQKLKSDQLKIIQQTIQKLSKEQIQNIYQSIKSRYQINIHKKQNYIQNPLYEKDYFGPAQIIISQQIERDKNSNEIYLQLKQWIDEDHVYFIDSADKEFDLMCIQLSNQSVIGFDTQFRCTSSKFEQQGVSLMQLSSEQVCYVIDFIKMENNQSFKQFIVNLFCNPNIAKIGHTVSSDIKYLSYTFKIPGNQTKGFIDIAQLFKKKYPDQKYSSLAHLCQVLLGKKLSKYEQRSNWNRRPLKKTQMHYAALDSYVCLKILKELRHQNGKLNEIDGPKQKIPVNKNIHRSEQLTYNKKFIHFLDKPKFLIDNMLKKLCSIMRNCGLDAYYISVRDYELTLQLASKQERIIITRDSKFFQRKDNNIPIYLLKNQTDSDKMFLEIVDIFKLNLKEYQTLSRCVKCNSPDLILISVEEAMKQINFKHQKSLIRQFWKCEQCKQIYWEGGQFNKAKKRYNQLKN